MKRFLYDHAALNPVSFHMPGHKGGALFREYGYEEFLENFMDMDVTEIPGADNLFDADGIIDEVQKRYARLYGARRSWMIVNGTSGSLIAAILAVSRMWAACKSKPRFVIGRNCHKAVFNGLRLAGAEPVYAYPEIVGEYGIAGEVTPGEIGRLVKENPDAAGVIITSPNYYGICSDIEAIAQVAHEAGMVLIVDQAHGAHLKFFHDFGCGSGMPGVTENQGADMMPLGAEDQGADMMPLAAEDQGADIVCCSTHKTLASMTQSAVLNLCSDRVDPALIDDCLQMVESSSPSYVLMTSLDINAELIENHGEQLFTRWRENLDYFYSQVADVPGLNIMKFGSMDPTKLNIDMGIPGAQLEEKLNERGIFPELYTGNILMCMTGIGNIRGDYDKLLDALREIGDDVAEEIAGDDECICAGSDADVIAGISDSDDNTVVDDADYEKQPLPGEFVAVPEDSSLVPIEEAGGMICAYSIIPYPPGSPLVCPGEIITEEIVRYASRLWQRGYKMIGIDREGRVRASAKR